MSRKQTPKTRKQPSKSAKILYRPIGLASSVVGGLIAGQVFKQGWKRAAPKGHDAAPKSLDSGYPIKEILLATVIQGAVFAFIKTIIDRTGARLFERLTGEWPGS